LGKASWERLSYLLTKDALRGPCRPLKEMVKGRTQEQSFPAAKSYTPIFECSEGLLQIATGVRAPKVAIEIRILFRRLVAHCCMMLTPRIELEMSSL
jgi:hypothetical protein